ncbi:HEPN domain-containing protein [Streptomyces sp. NPDC001634]|uniref:HEPN domain-containing protein n=1 Tax=Streptomyces sp. NPDC001634 TaxID=3154390 RepID=UPI00331F87F5
MVSSRFEELEKRIVELRQCFLPKEFDPTGLYEETVYEHTRAFRVLAHAEFESFIEDRVIEVVDEAVSNWKTDGSISTSLLAIMAYRESVPPMPGSLSEAAAKPDKYPKLEARIDAARTDLHRYVRNQNHGIKEKNLLRLLLPVGIQEAEIDSAWLSATETWATARGDAAHKGAKMQVRPDPQNELKTVNLVLDGFRDLDEQMQSK